MQGADAVIIVVMGVSGSGKTTVGRKLSERLKWPYVEADDFQPPENVAKMARGEPLTDVDRAPWLRTLRQKITKLIEQNENAIVSSSALKHQYRYILRGDSGEAAKLVFLKGSYDLIKERMQGREHFFKPEMLDSQFDTLEEPALSEALVVEIDQPVDSVVDEIVDRLALE